MGSPISPFFADLVMEDLEIDCLHTLKHKHSVEPVFYFRYVDDICMCIKKEHIELVVKVFNSYDKHLQFTFELEDNNRINFLDLTLIKDNNRIITDWFKKPTSSDRMINYFSDHPIQQKKNIVFNLVDRAISLSHSAFHSDNLKKVKSILKMNNYPIEFSEKYIKVRLNKIKFANLNNVKNNKSDIYKRIFKVGLPFVNNCFFELSNILREHNISTIPLVNKNTNTIVQLGKDVVKKWDRTNIVYKFTCKDCPACYIGETKRSFLTRVNEHRKNTSLASVVYNHRQNMHHDFDWDNAKILDYESNWKKRTILEMIHIKSNCHTINKKEDAFSLNRIYFPLLRCLKF